MGLPRLHAQVTDVESGLHAQRSNTIWVSALAMAHHAPHWRCLREWQAHRRPFLHHRPRRHLPFGEAAIRPADGLIMHAGPSRHQSLRWTHDASGYRYASPGLALDLPLSTSSPLGQRLGRNRPCWCVRGLSYLVRPSAIVLIPAVLAWLVSQRDFETPSRNKAAFAYLLSFLLVITPQLIIDWAQTGSPFYNSRAKDVWMDIYGNWDWALWPTIGEISMMDLILMDPVRFLANWAGNLLETLRHSPIDWPLAWFTIPGFLALPFTRPKRKVGLIYWFCGAYLALVSLAWSTLSQSRIFLMVVPFALMVAVWLFLHLVPSDLRVAQQKIPWKEPLFLLALLLMLWNGKPYIDFLRPGVERHHSFVKPEVQTPLRANLDNKALLIGYQADKRELHPGDTLYLTLYWQAQYVGSENYSVFIHLVGKDDHLWAQDDSWPRKSEHPTSLWLAGEFIQDPHELVVPPDTPPGPYVVVVGMYLLDTGERLNVIDEDGQPRGNAIILEPFQVLSP